MSKSKTCTKCSQIKSLDDFNKDASSKSGIQTKCRDCEKEIRRAYYLKNKDKEIARVSRWHKETLKGQMNRDKYGKSKIPAKNQYRYKPYIPVIEQTEKQLIRSRAKASKRNAKRRAILKQADRRLITIKEVKRILNNPCFYCGSKDRITLDHIIPLARGGRHSIGNLLPACFTCNVTKNARFIMEMRLNKTRADSLRRVGP